MLYRWMKKEYDGTPRNSADIDGNEVRGVSFCLAGAVDFWKENIEGAECLYTIDIDIDTEADEYGLAWGEDYGEVIVPTDVVGMLGMTLENNLPRRQKSQIRER